MPSHIFTLYQTEGIFKGRWPLITSTSVVKNADGSKRIGIQ